MTILVDHQIAQRMAEKEPLATGVRADDYREAKSPIQAASLDLTIGEIFLPGTSRNEFGGEDTPLDEISLDQGQTAVIRTRGILHIPSDLAGIAFPPASVSRKGLLTTNPGHIDPGYRGPLHLTVINMGRTAFPLRAGDPIMSVILLDLAERPSAPYNVRFPDAGRRSPITTKLLGRLSIDFLDVDRRATKALLRATALGGAAGAILAAVLAGVGSYWTAHDARVQDLTMKVTEIDSRLGSQRLDDRVQKLEEAITELKKAKAK